MRVNRVHVPIVFALAILSAGCGGSGSGSASDCPRPDASIGPRHTTGSGTDVTYLTGVSVEPGRCGDRVIFEFRDGIPATRIEYLPRDRALVEDGSGEQLEAEGEAFLVVRLDPAATAESNGDELSFTYTGPRRLHPDGAEFVREVLKTGDFEAVVTWAVGVADERPFSVVAAGRQITVELE